MKPRQPNFRQFWDDFFGHFRKLPPPPVDPAWDRVLDRLQDHPDDVLADTPAISSAQPSRRWRRGVLLAAAVMVMALVVFVRMPVRLHAVLESADGGLFRVSGGQAVLVGETVDEGEIVRTDRGLGVVLALADGSRIEMRPQSALSLERADDGARIRLDTGGVIISAAEQRAGHLQVQTRDATVSVVGTVFLVSTEQAGSRVAVIQGEVQVQQGAVIKKLAPGQQIATNPLMESHPVREEISWSRQAEAHMALLQQSTATGPGAAAASPEKLEFEAVSLKPFPTQINDPNYKFLDCRGVDGVWSFGKEVSGSGLTSPIPVPQGRCVGSAFLRMFVAVAYGIPQGRISGDEVGIGIYYQLEAKAENPSTATKEDLRQMLQAMVMDRFKLKAHRYTQEMPGYVLLVAKDGVKFKETSGDEDFPSPRMVGQWVPGTPGYVPMLIKGKFGLKRFTEFVTGALNANVSVAPVIDKTELTGIYDISLTLHQFFGAPGVRGGGATAATQELWDPPIAKALEDQLGLSLESAGKVPVEYLAVDHVEKPSEN